MENWKLIDGYSNYEISDLGNIRNADTNRILKKSIDSRGYNQIWLSKNGIQKQFLVHRIVAKSFIPNPNNYPQVNHKDFNKLNNIINNLEWCDNGYNTSYSKVKTSKSKTRGITYNKSSNNWMVRLPINKKQIYIGSYKTIEEAKEAIKNYHSNMDA